jgi:hypothetical protein
MTGVPVLPDKILATLKAFAGDGLLKGLEGIREWDLAQGQSATAAVLWHQD